MNQTVVNLSMEHVNMTNVTLVQHFFCDASQNYIKTSFKWITLPHQRMLRMASKYPLLNSRHVLKCLSNRVLTDFT